MQGPPTSDRAGIWTWVEAPCFTSLLWNCLPWLSTGCLLPTPFIPNPIHIHKLIQRAAVVAMNLWVGSTGSNCNLWTILWRYLRVILWNPNQMWFTPKYSNSISSWSREMKFAERSSLHSETPYIFLPKARLQFSSGTAYRMFFQLWQS